MLLSPSSRVEGRVARRVGTILVTRLSYHSKPSVAKFSATHAQRQSRTKAPFSSQTRSFTAATYWTSVGRNTYASVLRSRGRSLIGKVLGGLAGAGVGIIIFGPSLAKNIGYSWSLNQPSDGPYNRASSAVLYPYWTEKGHETADGDVLHRDFRTRVFSLLGIIGCALVWPAPFIGLGLLTAATVTAFTPAVAAVTQDDVGTALAHNIPVDDFPWQPVQMVAPDGDVKNLNASAFNKLPEIPAEPRFDKLRAKFRLVCVFVTDYQKLEPTEKVRQMVADGQATHQDFQAFVTEIMALLGARRLAEYQNVHRKLTDMICLVEAGKDDEASYQDFVASLKKVCTDPSLKYQRKNSAFKERDRTSPNVYSRPIFTRPRPVVFV